MRWTRCGGRPAGHEEMGPPNSAIDDADCGGRADCLRRRGGDAYVRRQQHVDVDRRWITPGLIDRHTHRH